MQYAKIIANERHELHRGQDSSRPLAKDYELVGLSGEIELGKAIGQSPDYELKPGGDMGIDFMVPLMYSVDVKTANIAGNLLVEIGHVHADIYVLAAYMGDGRAELLGWAWAGQVLAAPTGEFGYDIINHFIAKDCLNPMAGLLSRIGRIKK